MKSWRIPLFLILFLIILAPALWACAGSSPPITVTPVTPLLTVTPTVTSGPVPLVQASNTPKPSPTPEPSPTATPIITKLVLWENLPPAQADQLAVDITQFNESFPNILIDYQHYDQPQTLAAAILEGRVDYDILLTSTSLLRGLQQAGKLQPVDAFFPPGFLDEFAGVTLTGATRQKQVWGLPDTAGFHLLLFYNKDLLESPPVTVTDMQSLAETLTTDSRQGLVFNAYDPLWVLPWLGGYGGNLVDEAGKPALNSPAMVSALTLHQSLSNRIGPLNYVEARDLFSRRQAAMILDGEWAITELAAQSVVAWGVAPLPVVGDDKRQPAPLVLARYWAIGAETSGRRAEAAIKFMEFITDPNRQLVWTEAFGLLPTRRDALNAPLILTSPALRTSAAQMQAGVGLPLEVNAETLLDSMRQPLQQLLTGELSPAEAAAQMQENTR